MPSVYTIQGAGGRRRKRKSSAAQKAAQKRMSSAAKKCKGLKAGKFRSCMKRELKK